MKLTTSYKKLLADTITPVSLYLKLRDHFANTILLESSDYHGKQNRFSYLCCAPIASFKVMEEEITTSILDEKNSKTITSKDQVLTSLKDFIESFEAEKNDHEFILNGAFGHISYDAIRYFEDVEIDLVQKEIPDIQYFVYQIIVAIDQFKNELYLIENLPENDKPASLVERVQGLISNRSYSLFPFKALEESSNYSDQEFEGKVKKGIEHCHRGDVFQVVLSRRFERSFEGDEFNVYRSLRSINPSPYLFYFDFGNYKLFGSSPEAQLEVSNDTAAIFPIAGTFKRTGNDQADMKLAEELAADPKENSEHVMLVDLARNDLSKHGENVKVEVYKEVQFYSHVIHLVSKVTASLKDKELVMDLAADTFPAGTLSGAPKHRALQLINQYEKVNRSIYGGAIGFIGFDGTFNHAIMIRTFLSANNTLRYQAGAGIVAKSDSKNELEEVNNKLAALRQAVDMAESIEL